MAKLFKVTGVRDIIRHNGVDYHPGEEFEVTEDQATALGDAVEIGKEVKAKSGAKGGKGEEGKGDETPDPEADKGNEEDWDK